MVNNGSMAFADFEDYVKKPKIVYEKKTYRPLDKADIISLKAEIKRKEKEAKKQQKLDKKAEKKKEKRVSRISKKVEKNVGKIIESEEKLYQRLEDRRRLTTPKKRNIFSRLYLSNKYYSEDFEYIADEIDMIKNGELPESAIEDDWKDIQKYEDAKDDVTLRRGWQAFKITLAGVALAGALFLGKTAYDEVSGFFDKLRPQSQATSITQLDEEKRVNVEEKAVLFQAEVTQRDGYVFDNLSQFEIAEGYFKLINYEKGIYEGQFNNVMNSMRDQEYLDNIVRKTYGEEFYKTLSPEKQRDYRQLAFETLFVAQPEYFNEESVSFIRNPIIIDHLNMRDAAQEKGYHMHLTVNNDKKETIRNIELIIRAGKTTQASDFEGANLEDGGQGFLEQRVMDILGESYENLKNDAKRSYLQIAYESLPENIKGEFVKDPIDIEREARETADNIITEEDER